MERNIEVELRNLVDESKFKEILQLMESKAEFLGEEKQVTTYFDAKTDLRTQLNNNSVILKTKSGKIHDEEKEEVEIDIERENYNKVHKLINNLGIPVKVQWFRKRRTYKLQDFTIALDFTEGYGYIVEIEMMAHESERKGVLEMVRAKMKELGIEETPKDFFDNKYEEYVANWRDVLNIQALTEEYSRK